MPFLPQFFSFFKLIFSCSFFIVQFSCLANEQTFDHDHKLWTKILKQVVVIKKQSSWVDYTSLKKDSSDIDRYIVNLQRVTLEAFSRFSRDQQLCFLINAYNSFQIKQVLLHYPIDSIVHVGSLFTSPWQKKFFRLFNLNVSLDFVEHDLIRQIFKEPRIHFAVSCASSSCPLLSDQAYTANQLDKQLEVATVNFLNNQKKNYYDPEGQTLFLSKIFDWYKNDFGKNWISFITSRIEVFKRSPANIENLTIKYNDYDWALNDLKNAK